MAKKKHNTEPVRDVDVHVADWLKENKKSARTAAAYKFDLNAFLAYAGKDFKAVTPADVNAWKDTLTGAEATIQRKVVAVRSFYDFCNAREITSLNLSAIKVPKVRQDVVSKDKLLTRAEVKAMIEAAEPDVEGWLFVRLLYTCGLRVSEALALRWRDLSTVKAKGKTQGYIHVKGKGRKFVDVPVPPELWRDLAKHRKGADETDHLFPGIQDRHAAARLVMRLAKAAKISKEVSPHSFRHACVSHLLAKGSALPAVRDLVRHANISTTHRYAHASGVEELGRVLEMDEEE